jgi:hypothetical protein
MSLTFGSHWQHRQKQETGETDDARRISSWLEMTSWVDVSRQEWAGAHPALQYIALTRVAHLFLADNPLGLIKWEHSHYARAYVWVIFHAHAPTAAAAEFQYSINGDSDRRRGVFRNNGRMVIKHASCRFGRCKVLRKYLPWAAFKNSLDPSWLSHKHHQSIWVFIFCYLSLMIRRTMAWHAARNLSLSSAGDELCFCLKKSSTSGKTLILWPPDVNPYILNWIAQLT